MGKGLEDDLICIGDVVKLRMGKLGVSSQSQIKGRVVKIERENHWVEFVCDTPSGSSICFCQVFKREELVVIGRE